MCSDDSHVYLLEKNLFQTLDYKIAFDKVMPTLVTLIVAFLHLVRERCSNAELAAAHVHICSKNNFPTAAGLASSAAGYACLGMIKCNYSIVIILTT